MVLSSMQLQKVSVTLWFRRLQCLVLRSVLSVFSTCVLQSVCVHTMDFVSAINKQINIIKSNLNLVEMIKYKSIKWRMDLTKMQKDCIPNPSRVHLWSFFGHIKVACISCSKLGLDLWKLLRGREVKWKLLSQKSWSVCDPVVFAHLQCGIDLRTSGRMGSLMFTPRQTNRPKTAITSMCMEVNYNCPSKKRHRNFQAKKTFPSKKRHRKKIFWLDIWLDIDSSLQTNNSTCLDSPFDSTLTRPSHDSPLNRLDKLQMTLTWRACDSDLTIVTRVHH